MFGDVLFFSTAQVLSRSGADLMGQFLPWRQFGFEELRHGALPLWNPHIYAGAPYFGGFQSALLYPPNAVYLVLPLVAATNWGIALHVFLAGLFMYLWTRGRGLHPLAALLSGALCMFGSTYFLHIFAGHLPNLCTMVWIPLIFLCIDKVFCGCSWGWTLGGMSAVAMSVLAGHPQYFFFCSVSVVLYVLLLTTLKGMETAPAGRLAGGPGVANAVAAPLAVCAMYAGGLGLSAVQLLTGLDAGGESVRTNLSYESAKIFSFPWTGLVTLLCPKIFGEDLAPRYWGHWYFWEMIFYIGITGLFFAVYGAIKGEPRTRRFSITMLVLLLLLALGCHTPLYPVLFRWIPGFSLFRGMSKFIFPASLFLTMLAAIGFDVFLRRSRVSRTMMFMSSALTVGLLVFGFLARTAAWPPIMGLLAPDPTESYAPVEAYTQIDYVRDAGLNASANLLAAAAAAGVLTALLACLWWSRKHVMLVCCLIVALGISEVFVFARTTRPTFDAAKAQMPEIERFIAQHPGGSKVGGYRFLPLFRDAPNFSMTSGGESLWGYDPLLLRRYGEFMFFTQGLDPDDAGTSLTFRQISPLFTMLRCRYLFYIDSNSGHLGASENPDSMPQFQLIGNYSVLGNRDAIFSALHDSTFDPRHGVILESEPDPVPTHPGETGTVTVLDASTDRCDIEADLPAPAILLMTDPYSKGWHARALQPGPQASYQVMPANYILRAIPLAQGHHRIRIEYKPTAFTIGLAISLVCVAGYFCLLGWRLKLFFTPAPAPDLNCPEQVAR